MFVATEQEQRVTGELLPREDRQRSRKDVNGEATLLDFLLRSRPRFVLRKQKERRAVAVCGGLVSSSRS